jgi:hypothetical protein
MGHWRVLNPAEPVGPLPPVRFSLSSELRDSFECIRLGEPASGRCAPN